MAAMAQRPAFTPLKRETATPGAEAQLRALDALLEARGFGAPPSPEATVFELLHTSGEGNSVLERVEDLLERYQARGESVQRLAGRASALDAHRRGNDDELGALPACRKELKACQLKLKQTEAAKRRAEAEKFAEAARTHEARADADQCRLKRTEAEAKLRIADQKLREETLNRKRAEGKLNASKTRALKPQKTQTTSSARELFEAATGRAPRPTSAADQRALEVAEVGARCRAKLEEDVARLRGDVEVLRNALDSQPAPAPVVEASLLIGAPQTVVDDVCAALEEAALATVDDAADTTVPPTPHNSRSDLAAAAVDPQLEAQRTMIERAAERNRDLAAALEHANGRLQDLENEREALASRPTARAFSQKNNEVKDLEQKLHDVRGQARTHERALRRYAGTKELVRRDRLDYALDLKSLDAMPKNVAVDVVKEVCRDLRLNDAGECPPAVRKLCAATKKLPALLQFAQKACGMLDVVAVGGGPLPLEAALDALEASKLSKSEQAALVEHVAATLDSLRRADCAPATETRADAAAVRKAVDWLLAEKAHNAKNNAALRDCNALVAETPDATCGRVLNRVREQLNVPEVKGIVPTLARRLSRCAELETFCRAAADRLGVAPPARTGAILGAIDRRLTRRKKAAPALPASTTELVPAPATTALATTADEVDDFEKALAAASATTAGAVDDFEKAIAAASPV